MRWWLWHRRCALISSHKLDTTPRETVKNRIFIFPTEGMELMDDALNADAQAEVNVQIPAPRTNMRGSERLRTAPSGLMFLSRTQHEDVRYHKCRLPLGAESRRRK